MQTLLISGFNGLLGRSLAARLVHAGQRVIGITRSETSLPMPSIEYCRLDFASEWTTRSLPARVDTIIHLAQSANFRAFPESALHVFKVNIESTARLLDYAKSAGVKKFIYASSGGVYGHGAQAFKENARIVPPMQLGFYLGSKACGEILVKSYSSVFDVVVMRPFFIYGPGQKREMLIPRLFDLVIKKKPISLQGKSGIRINPIHVEDATAAVTAALNLKESATFNIAGPDVLSVREICEGMGRFLSLKPIFELKPGKPNDLVADISAMREQLHIPIKHLNESLRDVAF